MESYRFLFDLAVILLSTKLLGMLSKRIKTPEVVGALLAGLFLGPAMLGIISQTDFIEATAEVGVVLLMFNAGLETDLQEMKKAGLASFVIALIGVIVPLVGGYLVAFGFNRPGVIDSDASCSLVLQNIFLGVIITATSVSITVEALKELGKLKTNAGTAILGAAIIDDILGIVGLTLITSMADESIKISTVLIKILLFFVFTAIVCVLFSKFYERWSSSTDRGRKRYACIALVFALLMAFCAEVFFGVADITGAYFAGLALSWCTKRDYLMEKFEVLSSLYLSPIFFASIGLKVDLPNMTAMIVLFSVVFTIVAVLTKILGCGFGAKIMRYTNKEALQIGIGMVSRGEVALIVASKGEALGLISSQLMGPVVIVVIITTIITPIMLKPAFKDKNDAPKLKEHDDAGIIVEKTN